MKRERERQRDRERERERQTDRQTDRQRHRERHRQTQRQRDRDIYNYVTIAYQPGVTDSRQTNGTEAVAAKTGEKRQEQVIFRWPFRLIYL